MQERGKNSPQLSKHEHKDRDERGQGSPGHSGSEHSGKSDRADGGILRELAESQRHLD